MQPSSKRRLVGGAAALMLIGATLLSTAGVATAATPNWSMHVQPLPGQVTPGANAGYLVTITNAGPSNISQLFLTNDPSKGNPTYVLNDPNFPGACSPVGVALLCSFGALNAGQSVTVTIGFTTSGTGSFDPVFEANTSGVSFTDPHRSHGDTLIDGTFTGTVLVTNKNFGGGFTVNGNGSVGNNSQLNGQNKQSEKISHLPAGIAATVQDGSTTGFPCTSDGVVDCSKLIGEWSILSVNNGADFSATPTHYFIVQVTFKSGTPHYFVHAPGGNYPNQEDILPCVGGVFDGSTQCFTWDAGTNTATVYLFHNNPLRG
jgi:hypothetical protein